MMPIPGRLEAVLKTLVPLSSLVPTNFEKLMQQTRVEQLPGGGALFKQGDIDNWRFYLLAGEVTLMAKNSTSVQLVSANNAVAKHPLADHQPRQCTATAKTAVSFIRVDSQMLDLLLTWDQVAGYEVMEFDGDSSDADWMTKILQTKAFLRLPPANIQTLFSRLQEVEVKSGQIVIKEGDRGDYYYIVKEGRCAVTRQVANNGPSTNLAELSIGDSFGEEALLSDAPRNATITMLSDGRLMRLAKGDFTQLMKEPLLNSVGQDEAVAMVKAGAGLLDVRLESEYKNGNIKGSVNLPLYTLRLRADSLDRNRKYVAYCDTGRRSSAAAFLLGERGIETYVLRGGLTALARTGSPP